MSSQYPNNFDTDLELPRVDNNISEIGGDAINSLRDAVIMIEETVGLDPQGNKPSLASRIDVALDDNGNIRASAIETLGLVSLPIDNSQIADDAAILESKLDLDFSTQALKNMIASNDTDIAGLQTGVGVLSSNFTLHTLGNNFFHDGYSIHINLVSDTQYGLAGLSATNVGDALNELVTLLISGDGTTKPHINLNLPSTIKHEASDISIDATNFQIIDRTATNVQAAISDIDAKQGAFGKIHVSTFHSNGVLNEISSGDTPNTSQLLLGPVSGVSYSESSTVLTVPGVSSWSDLGVVAGDLVQISNSADAGIWQVDAVGPLDAAGSLGNLPTLNANQLSLFHIFQTTETSGDGVIATIYKPANTSSQKAPLAVSVRNNETIVDTLAILNPSAARVVSVGFNGAILNGDGYQICVRAGVGSATREITIPNLNCERLNINQASVVDARSVAERINAYVSDPTLDFHFPISAFPIGDELAIAHNLVGSDYTLEILDGYNGNRALGLDDLGANVVGSIIKGNLANSYAVNGEALNSLTTTFDGYAKITTATDTFSLYLNSGTMINPLDYGLGAGSAIHIISHPNFEVNGTYTLLTSTSTTVSTFAAEPIPAPSNPTIFSVLVSSSTIALNILGGGETDQGLVQIAVDDTGTTLKHQRLTYGTGLGASIEIVDISDNFPLGTVELNITAVGGSLLFTMIASSLSGTTLTIEHTFKGLLKIYHANNLDWIIVKVKDGTVSGGSENLVVSAPLPADEAMELALVHFNGDLKITNVVDKRFFGNLGVEQARDDLIEKLVDRPTGELRADGVARGFDVLNIPFQDDQTGMQALPVQGGVAYVNGVRVAVETQRVLIQSYDDMRVLVPNQTLLVALNQFGSLQTFNKALGDLLTDGYAPSSEYGRLLPLYQVELDDAGIISDFIDLRLFINNLDAKLELIVDEASDTNIIGNFRSLEGALLYAASYPNKEHLTIKIVNSVFPSRQIVVPNGVSLLGSSNWGGQGTHQIVNENALGASFIVLEGNNRLENLEITSTVATLDGALVEIAGDNVLVEKCAFNFGADPTSTAADVGILVSTSATKDVQVSNNRFDTIYSGVVSLFGVENLKIINNKVTNLKGTGSISSGISIGNSARAVIENIVNNNFISVPSVVSPADIRGISVDVGSNLTTLRINDNTILHTALNTMTNGIRVENVAATGSTLAQLFISGNLISGIKLDDNNIWGIYVADTDNAFISENMIENVGIASNTSVGAIEISSNVGFASIMGNTIKNCILTRGIEITGTNKAAISNNTLDTLGTNAYYISGAGINSSITNNQLVGPGLKGIRWTGTNSTIANNNLSQPASGSNYAFSEHAIYVQTSDCDISNNTITGMISIGSIGFTNVGSGRERLKIIGNTFSGSQMSKILEIFSDGHVISNNRILNNVSSSTSMIQLNSVSNSVVMGNLLRGSASSAIQAVTALSAVTIANNIIDARNIGDGATTISNALVLDVASNCFVAGNQILNNFGTVGSNTIGTSTETSFSNNSIGANSGFKDFRNLHASIATASYDTGTSTYTWAQKGNNYWELFNTSSITRVLYFPIELPNGVRLLSVQAQGLLNGDGTLTIRAFRKDRSSSTFAGAAISSSGTITSSPFGKIGGAGNAADGLVATTTNSASGELIDNYSYSYHVTITHTGGSSTPSTIQIHGLSLVFRY